MAILMMPFTRLLMPSSPKRRLRPLRGDSLEKSGLRRSAENTKPRLQHMARNAPCRRESQRSAPSNRPTCRTMVPNSSIRPLRIHWHLVGLFEKDTEHLREAFRGRLSENRNRQRAAREHEEGRDFLAFDDVAFVGGLVEPPLSRLFCLLGLSIVGHGSAEIRHLRGVEIEEHGHHRTDQQHHQHETRRGC